MWEYVVVEGYCFGENANTGERPCGRPMVSDFCLQEGCCPHFAYAPSNEREAAWNVPLRLVLWDKLVDRYLEIREVLSWYLWGRWRWDEKKWKSWLDSMRVAELPELDEMLHEAEEGFAEWFSKVTNSN